MKMEGKRAEIQFFTQLICAGILMSMPESPGLSKNGD